MSLRRLLATGFVAGFVAAASVGASAHSVNDYPSNGWKYTITTRTFRTAPNDWQSTFNARTDAAMATWTALGGSNLVQQRGGVATSDNWVCGTGYDFLRYAAIPSGSAGQTQVCQAVNSTVQITMKNPANWYTGSSTPNPANTTDFQGIIAHELGHAHQAWMFCTSGSGEPCPGGHYDTTYNLPLCDTGTPAQLHTMCRSVTAANSWRQRSLETHDVDLVEAMY